MDLDQIKDETPKTKKNVKATKTTKPKATKAAKTTKPKTKSTKPVQNIVEVSKIQKKFSDNTVKQFFNHFFGNTDRLTANVSVQIFNPKKDVSKNLGANVFDVRELAEPWALYDVAREFKEKSEFKDVSAKILTPYLHTALNYFQTKDADMETIFKAFGYSYASQKNYNTISSMLKDYIIDSENHKTKMFNYAFSPVFVDAYPDKKDVYKRYLQTAPKSINKILQLDHPSVEDACDAALKIYTKSNTYSKLLTKETQKNLIRCISNGESYVMDGLDKEQKKNMTEVLRELKLVKMFVDKLSIIDDDAVLGEAIEKYNTCWAEYQSIASDIAEYYKKRASKSDFSNDSFETLVYILAHTSKFFNMLKHKSGFNTSILNAFKKEHVNVSFKNNDFKKEINKLVLDDKVSEKAIHEICLKHKTEYQSCLDSSKLLSPMKMDIYDKIGFCYYKFIDSDKCARIPRFARVAMGFSIFARIVDWVVARVESLPNVKNFKFYLKF